MIPLLPVVLAMTVFAPEPIVRRDDRPDSAYCHIGARYKSLVTLGRAGDGTLIAPTWVLTAGHVGRSLAGRIPSNRKVQIGGEDYGVTDVVVHPDWTEMGPHDIALVHLARVVRGVTPVPIYRRQDESGHVAVILGHGKSGTGSSRQRADDGKARGAMSRVDSADARWLYFSFDAPPGGTKLEGAPGGGDSGGPALLESRGKTYVAGVSSAGYDGRDGPATYGAIDVFTRVSTHAVWIDKVLKRSTTSRTSGTASGLSSARGI